MSLEKGDLARFIACRLIQQMRRDVDEETQDCFEDSNSEISIRAHLLIHLNSTERASPSSPFYLEFDEGFPVREIVEMCTQEERSGSPSEAVQQEIPPDAELESEASMGSPPRLVIDEGAEQVVGQKSYDTRSTSLLSLETGQSESRASTVEIGNLNNMTSQTQAHIIEEMGSLLSPKIGVHQPGRIKESTSTVFPSQSSQSTSMGPSKEGTSAIVSKGSRIPIPEEITKKSRPTFEQNPSLSHLSNPTSRVIMPTQVIDDIGARARFPFRVLSSITPSEIGNFQLICKHCHGNFTCNNEFFLHLEIKHPEKCNFECVKSGCFESFSTRALLQAHLSEKHHCFV